MKFSKIHAVRLAILILLLAGAWFRGVWYGDLRLSIANVETISYIKASQAPLFSWKIFAGSRLFTTNLIYKMANDERACPITAFSAPAAGAEDVRAIQLCFDRIALLQNILAILSWGFLAWTTAKFLRSPAVKIAAAAIILLFGFTPQIAEWDSILSPESLSLSLFAVSLALAMEIAFRIAPSEVPFQSRLERNLLVAWTIVFLLWVFVRDVHLYAVPITLGLLAILFLGRKFRDARPLTAVSGILLIFFVVGYLSARDSFRATRTPILNSIDEYIWPHPARVEFFRRFGMPERDAPDYQDWADHNAPKAYGLFLVTHPGFVVTTLWENFEQLNSDFIQPYFYAPEVEHRDSLLRFGEFLHPETGAVYLFSLIILAILSIHSLRNHAPIVSAWTWLAFWFFGAAAATLFLSYFGDTAGLRRHIMPSVEMFRLFVWVFLMPFFDLSLERSSHE